jgi:hypothetical protein
MRWSLILSAFIIAQFALSFAAVRPSLEGLERRAKGARVPSKTYRNNAEEHDYAYKFDLNGGVTREKLEESERHSHNEKILMVPKTDADHIFEHQILDEYLKENNLKFGELDSGLQEKVKRIINGPENVAAVLACINRGKGQVIKHALAGNSITPKKDRDEYIKITYKIAVRTAKALDKAFKTAGHQFGDNTLYKMLDTAMNNAKLREPGDPSPSSSGRTSSAGSKAGSPANSRPGTPDGSGTGPSKGTPKTGAKSKTPAMKVSKAPTTGRRSARIEEKAAEKELKKAAEKAAKKAAKEKAAKEKAAKEKAPEKAAKKAAKEKAAEKKAEKAEEKALKKAAKKAAKKATKEKAPKEKAPKEKAAEKAAMKAAMKQ